MKYWILHTIIILIILFVWFSQTERHIEHPKQITPPLDSVIVGVDTILNKTVTERRVKVNPPPTAMRMVQPIVVPIDTTLDTLWFPPPAPIMLEEPEPKPTYITKRDTKVDTVYRYVYEIQQPIIREQPPQQSSVLDNINVLVTIFGGLLNIIILVFQLKDRKSK